MRMSTHVREALSTVLELAQQNVLDDDYVLDDNLQNEQNSQQSAVDTVEEWLQAYDELSQ